MPRYEKDAMMTLLGEELLIEDVLKSLVLLPAEEILDFFKEINLNFPRELRIDALRETFRERVFQTRQERHNLADEMNYRLSWFNQFSEVQLVNLFKFYKDDELFLNFREELWLNILENITDRNIAESQLAALFKLANDNEDKNTDLNVNPIDYNKSLDELFYDDDNKIDGLIQEEIRPVLYRSSTITEIRELGKKYGVNVPTRLKKNELIEIICDELKERNEYTKEIEEELKKMNLVLIQRYAKVNDIKASPELKKEEVIEYVLANAEETKEIYYVPSPSVYEEIETEEPELEHEEIEEVKEETIEEEVLLVEEETIEEEVLLVEEEVVEEEQAIVEDVTFVKKPKEFDINSVEKTVINVYEFSGTKKNQFRPELEHNTKDNEEGLMEIAETIQEEKSKKTFKAVLITMVVTVIVGLLIALLAYGYITRNNTPGIESNLPGFIIKILDFFRSLFS